MRYLLILIFVGLSASVAVAQSKPVKVGVLLCQTGGCAATGMAALHGIQIAVDEINNSGGLLGQRVEIVTQDSRDGESARYAVEAFRSLALDPEVHFFIGPSWSPAGMPLIPFFRSRSEIIIVSPSVGVSDFNEASDNIFNLRPPDKIGTQALARLAARNAWRNAAIVSAQDPWAADQARNFSYEIARQGGKIVASVEPLPTSADVRPEVLKIVATKPDVVLFTLFVHMRAAARYLREMGYTGNFMAVHLDQSMIKAVNGALEGTIFCNFPEASPEFTDKYVKRFKERPGISSDTGYDAVHLYERAIVAAHSFDPTLVKQQMLKIGWDGASGRITFDPKGGVKREPRFFKVVGTSFVPYEG